jgi:hypothetical protein
MSRLVAALVTQFWNVICVALHALIVLVQSICPTINLSSLTAALSGLAGPGPKFVPVRMSLAAGLTLLVPDPVESHELSLGAKHPTEVSVGTALQT